MIEGKSVTAVMFAYNEEKHISDALNSIVNQKEVDKIIFVDDQSTDNTMEVVKSLNSQIEIEIYENKNKGKANAFAYGLSKVNTDLFFVCHGDDILLPAFVENLYAFLKEKKINFCYASSTLCDENMVPIKNSVVKEVYSDFELLNRNSIGGYIFGYSKIIQNILPFPSDLKFEDWFTNMKLASIYKELHVKTSPTFLYRRHSNSDSIKLNKTLPERSYNLICRILDEDLIALDSEQRNELKMTRERYYDLSIAMNYLFINNSNSGSTKQMLQSKHLSFYVKSLIFFKKAFWLDKGIVLKLDSFLVNKIKR